MKELKIRSLSTKDYSGEVYNIEVESNHNYFANSILVSNCHENSTPTGKHADIETVKQFLNDLHPYTELAFGGGNVLSYPYMNEVLELCKERNLIPSITVNQKHFKKEYTRIKSWVDNNLVYGVGVSLTDTDLDTLELIKTIPNAVIHVIAGVITEGQIKDIADKGFKILILGYKQFRRGDSYYESMKETIHNNIRDLYLVLPRMINEKWFSTISFDNLALEQLNVKRLLSKDQWNEFFMGEDGFATFFIDLVDKKFSRNSTILVENRLDYFPDVQGMFETVRRK